jgi:hypothetical protein
MTMTVARPDIAITNVEELFADRLGQLWSPATITVAWAPVADLRAPSVQIQVIAHTHTAMTAEQLTREHLQAAHDVLTAALLTLECSLEAENRASHPKGVDRAADTNKGL